MLLYAKNSIEESYHIAREAGTMKAPLLEQYTLLGQLHCSILALCHGVNFEAN